MATINIVVCVKQVGCIYHPSALDLSTGVIDPEKMVFMLNPFDEVAVEAALRIKADVGDGAITLITVGRADAEQALRYAAAMGGPKVDRLLRINWDCAVDPDAWQTSLMLGDALKTISADLILCGKKAIDTNGCQVGAFIAEHLSLPQVSGIVELKLADAGKRAVVHRAMGKGDRMEVKCDLPAVLTVDLGLNDPRYPSMPDRFIARKMPVEVITPDASMDPNGHEALTRTTGFSFPRPKTRKVFTPDSNLSVTERMKAMLMGGGAKKAGGSVLEGTDDQLAGYLCDFLRENNILKKENA